MFALAKGLAAADLLPQKYRGRPANLMLALLKGEELGLSPMQSIGTINVIDGKAEIGARLSKALVLRSGKCRLWKTLESTREVCRIEVARSDWPEGMTEIVEYDIKEAEELGLTTKGRDPDAKARNPWVTQRKNMLKRRAESRAAGDVWPDVVIAYDHGELQDMQEREEAPAPMVGMRRVDFDPVVPASSSGGFAEATTAPRERSREDEPVDAELVDEQPPAATSAGAAAAAGDEHPPTRSDEASTRDPAPEAQPFAPASTDKVFLGALRNFCDSARKAYGLSAEAADHLVAHASAEAVADVYEAIVAGIDDRKRLQQSFAGLVQPFRATAPKSAESKEAASRCAALYNDRAKHLPTGGKKPAGVAGGGTTP